MLDHGTARSTMRAIDDETVTAVSSPKAIVVLSVDLGVARLAVGILDHRTLDFDRRSVLKPEL